LQLHREAVNPREDEARQSHTMSTITFELRGEYIALDALLKATGLAPSGGSARQLIVDGQVTVDDEVELRKTAKIRAGQCVAFGEHRVRLAAGPPQGEHSPSGGPTP
jgi:ribosome-associated protein